MTAMTSLRHREAVCEKRFVAAGMLIRISAVREAFRCEREDEEDLMMMNGRYVYGLEAENKSTGEQASAPGLTFDPNEAERLADICAAGLVTPVTLMDIIDDYLAE